MDHFTILEMHSDGKNTRIFPKNKQTSKVTNPESFLKKVWGVKWCHGKTVLNGSLSITQVLMVLYEQRNLYAKRGTTKMKTQKNTYWKEISKLFDSSSPKIPKYQVFHRPLKLCLIRLWQLYIVLLHCLLHPAVRLQLLTLNMGRVVKILFCCFTVDTHPNSHA